jgi:hypothetical protein
MRKPITTTHTAKPNKDPNNRAAPTLATHKEPYGDTNELHGDTNELQARYSNTARTKTCHDNGGTDQSTADPG